MLMIIVLEFVKREELDQDELYKSCERVQQMDSESLMCLDWILASTEYLEFVTMMLEFKVSDLGKQNWLIMNVVRTRLDGGRGR